MAITLYDLSVPTFLQTTRAMAKVLERTVRHCADTGANPDDIVQARLCPDMAPFHFQIESLRNHSVWGLQAVKTGVFKTPPLAGAQPFAALRDMLSDAVKALEALSPEEVNSWSGKGLDIDVFRPVDTENAHKSAWAAQALSFTPETYLLTYAMPNFYFHSVTAYAILRMRGMPIGKGDFEGRLRSQGG